ncbi:general secretion pathway protein H [Methylobacterium sp. 174MFSha1.1]|uniref:GspH/FimT family pseudopilin n=1 Tax=Methylobacterium sp. 174MFSha1.1 TaxID=1502749 RepID=UPI0008E48AE3|nr:GspH/FimT family pseudopilin [Methylobacterium sp. 174MFSha1.1]SFU48874.1 general secretion pathway protein H [Methylobacterium sp. 174MFSha1.1]
MTARRRDAAAGPAAGFSLVEMLVVLALLGLAAALGGPSLLTLLPGRQLDAAAASLADELALLRAEALRTGQRTSLAYDQATARFVSSRPSARPLAMAPLSVGVSVPAESWAGPGEIRFLPGGASTGGRIVLAGRAGQRVLTVSRVTGAVRRGETGP